MTAPICHPNASTGLSGAWHMTGGGGMRVDLDVAPTMDLPWLPDADVKWDRIRDLLTVPTPAGDKAVGVLVEGSRRHRSRATCDGPWFRLARCSEIAVFCGGALYTCHDSWADVLCRPDAFVGVQASVDGWPPVAVVRTRGELVAFVVLVEVARVGVR